MPQPHRYTHIQTPRLQPKPLLSRRPKILNQLPKIVTHVQNYETRVRRERETKGWWGCKKNQREKEMWTQPREREERQRGVIGRYKKRENERSIEDIKGQRKWNKRKGKKSLWHHWLHVKMASVGPIHLITTLPWV